MDALSLLQFLIIVVLVIIRFSVIFVFLDHVYYENTPSVLEYVFLLRVVLLFRSDAYNFCCIKLFDVV